MDGPGNALSLYAPLSPMLRPAGEDAAGTLPEGRLGASSAKLLWDILDSLADGVVVADLEGRFVLFNPAAEIMLGLGPLGAPMSDWSATYSCFREDGVTPFPSEELPLSRAIKGETIQDCVVFVKIARTPNGVWLSFDASPIHDAEGVLVGGAVVFRDVTAKRHELEHIELLSAVVEQTADSVVITDREGLIEYVNPALEKTTGFTGRELVGKTPRAFRSGAHDNAFYDELWATLAAGRVYRGTLVNRRRDDTVFYYDHPDPGRCRVDRALRLSRQGHHGTAARGGEREPPHARADGAAASVSHCASLGLRL
jgi:PAS domain S-box-containing protein